MIVSLLFLLGCYEANFNTYRPIGQTTFSKIAYSLRSMRIHAWLSIPLFPPESAKFEFLIIN